MHRQGNRSDRRFCNFTSAMTALNRQIKGELSDAELDSIAGGASAGEIVGYVSIGLIPAVIAAIWDCYLLQRLRAQLHSQGFLKEGF